MTCLTCNKDMLPERNAYLSLLLASLMVLSLAAMSEAQADGMLLAGQTLMQVCVGGFS